MAGEITLNGKDYIIEIDTETPITAASGAAYRPVVCEISSVFSIQTSELNVSSGDIWDWNESIPDKGAWAMAGEWQAINPTTGDPDAASLADIVDLAISKTKFWIRRKLKDGLTGAEIYREGVVWINNYEETATTEDPMTFSADFTGTGKPKATQSIIGVLTDYKEDPITVDDNYIIVKAKWQSKT